MRVIRDIGLMLIVLLLTACSKNGESPEDTKPVINIYVYAPDKPMITRGGVGDVTPIENTIDESKITILQIWVFDAETKALVSYYSPESVVNLNGTSGTANYQLSMSEVFAQKMQTAQEQSTAKPCVDVYVVANAASCGMTFSETTTRDELDASMIKKSETIDYFGLTTLTDKVPTTGLPMSGVLRGVEVGGSSPVYKLQNVKLTRAVSKIRFVFCREKPAEDQTDIAVKINSVELNAGMIPKEEYLFLGNDEIPPPYPLFNVGQYDTDDAKEFLPQALTDIPKCANPLVYVYQTQNAQDYENSIAEGVRNNELKQVGPYYLRESDKKLSGIIKYQKGEETAKEATFEMETAGDFSRNHTWIVYAYYSKSGLVAVTVVVKNWDEATASHEVYNW